MTKENLHKEHAIVRDQWWKAARALAWEENSFHEASRAHHFGEITESALMGVEDRYNAALRKEKELKLRLKEISDQIFSRTHPQPISA